MRAAAYCFLIAALLLPATAQAQVVIQDQSETFIATRRAHLDAMAGNAEKWWGGDVSDKPFRADSGASTSYSGGRALNHVPGNPLTVEPLFSMEEMMGADFTAPDSPSINDASGNNAANSAATTMSAPVTQGTTPAATMLNDATARLNAAFGSNVATSPQTPIAPPPIQDEGNAAVIDPADAPAAAGLRADDEAGLLRPDSNRLIP